MAAPQPEPSSASVTSAGDEHACCHALALETENTSQSAQDSERPSTPDHTSEKCPCEAQLGSRDLVSRDMVVPAPDATPQPVQFWLPITVLMIPATPLVERPFTHLDAPALLAALPPLYERHCALLL